MIYKIILAVFSAFTVSTGATLFAQNHFIYKDSLLFGFDTISETKSQVAILNKAAMNNLNRSGNSGLYFAQQALKIATSNDLKLEIAQSTETLAHIYLAKHEYLNALQNYTTASELYHKIPQIESYWNVKRGIGLVYYEMGEYTKALEEFLEVLRHYEKLKDFEGIATVTNHIGVLFHRDESFNKALEYYHRAYNSLKLETETESDILPRVHTNLGLTYYVIEDYKKAEEHFIKSLKANKKFGNPHIEAVNIGNLALVYSGLKNYHKAEKYFKEAIVKSSETGNRLSIAVNKGDLGRLYLTMAMQENKKFKKNQLLDKAISNLETALDTLDKLKDLRRYQGYTEELSLAYELKQQPRKALEIYKRHIVFKDSVFNIENSKALARKEISYYFSKRMDSIRLVNEKEIAVRDATLQANKKQRWFFFGGIFLLSIIGLLLFYQNRVRQKNNQTLKLLNEQLNEANQIKARFFSILNHDLRAPVSNVIKFLRIQQSKHLAIDESTRERLGGETVKAAENLLVSMEDMLLWSKGQMTSFKPQIKKVKIKILFKDFKLLFEDLNWIKITYENEENLELITDENYLKTIMRNLTSNAVKVLESSPDGHISWKAFTENGLKVLSITDNGPGIEEGKFRALYDDTQVVSNKTGMGLHLVRDMAKAIGVIVIVKSDLDRGTTIRLIFN